ncbi:hypothetical protein D8I35_01510 [Corticibacter populi]|uniref:Lipocalin-like domain-containing protein n=1 Tax=Corticibacter populi TaxID=1550736 RepID=A0A3M6QY39_9BURK|nr:hypothetical protein [Corticibacter populi]RMX07831.1 hypothetical protein D8I35_01510 [Corticibacter populi]RZS35066.1 hypothetical protein EV687_0120 [Corticibacter populi]
MKFKSTHVAFIAVAASVLLQACGGGGDGGEPANELDLSEFVGTWQAIEELSCEPDDTFWAPGKYWTVVAQDRLIFAQARLESRQTFYTDAQCQNKAGVITGVFDKPEFARHTISGRSNVIRASFKLTAFNVSADGGSGLQIDAIPDLNDPENQVKTLFDVENDQLFVGDDSALDANGYPLRIDAEPAYRRVP